MDRDWLNGCSCRGLDPAIFYPITEEDAEPAKAVCGVCPVQEACLEHAIVHREHNGVWGGATERERQRIIRRRRRMRALNAPATGDGIAATAGAPVTVGSAGAVGS
jgi:WhiB family redox-sensing transcriptional regulator